MALAQLNYNNAADLKETEFFTVLKERSRAKHQIFLRYFNAWVPIMCQSGRVPVYIDGFAGPGRYDDGSEGSPLLAFRAVAQHSHRHNFKTKLTMIFIEMNKEKADELRGNLETLQAQIVADQNNEPITLVDFIVESDTFRNSMKRILEGIQFLGFALFVFVDPFGFNGGDVPMSLMQAIIARARHAPTELFINVMDGFANRFFRLDSRAAAINELLGTDTWKESVCAEGIDADERLKRFMEIYWTQLSKDMGKDIYKLSFDMRNQRNRHIYHLMFVTGHPKGMEAIKDAMWSTSQKADHLVFSEWLTGRGDNFSSLSHKDRRAETAKIVSEILIEEFGGKGGTSGSEFEMFILLTQIYKFTVKIELKKIFGKFITRPARKFEDIIFSLPSD